MSVTPVFFFPFYPFYIKKEDAKDLVKFQRRIIAFILMATAIVLGIIQWTVSPKLLSMYSEFNVPMPFITQISSSVTMVAIIILAVISTYFLAKEPNYAELNEKLTKYKDGEMIRTKELIDIKKELVWLIPIFLMVAWLVYSTILPIYNLTATLE